MKDNFIPGVGYVSVEPIESSGVLVSDEKKFIERAKVISACNHPDYDIQKGDIIFFRPHGFFELAEYDGTVHYVVRVEPEFILGIIKHERKD